MRISRTAIKKLLLLLIFLSFAETVTGTPLLPVGRIEYEFIYDRLERQQSLDTHYFEYQLGPYPITRTDFDIAPFQYLSNIPDRSLSLFGFVGEDYRAARSNPTEGFESFRGGIAANPFENMFVYGNFVLDEKRAQSPTYTGKKWRGLAGDVEQAFAYYHTDRFNLTLGRFASFWGPRNSLVLGPTAALDGVGYSLSWGRLTLSYRLARLDGLNPDEDSVQQFENRYFAGHRLDVHLGGQLRVGFFETVIFGGPGRQLELFYLNPIIFFHGSQLNDGADDNTFVGLDFDFIPRPGFRFYGQLLIDDFQIEKRSQGDNEPSEVGLLMGTNLVGVLPGIDFKAEYTRVTNRTYNQGRERNRYLHNGELLSASLGNDYDQWKFSIVHWISPSFAGGVNFKYNRQGEGQVTDPWTTPWLSATGDYNEPFPTGIVQKTGTVSVSARGFIGNNLFIDMESGIDEVSNLAHQAGENRSLPFLQVKISTFFSTLLDID